MILCHYIRYISINSYRSPSCIVSDLFHCHDDPILFSDDSLQKRIYLDIQLVCCDVEL